MIHRNNPKRVHNPTGALTLIEVVLSVAIFTGVIVSVLGLLGPSIRRVGDVLDSSVAARIVDGVDFELTRIGLDPVASATNGSPLVILATADGSRVVLAADADNAVTDTPPGIPAVDERFFLIEVARLEEPAYATGDGYIGLSIRASWPHFRPGSTVQTPMEGRSFFVYSTALGR